MGTKTDAELISTLKRAWLLPSDGTTDPVAEAKFSLDAAVGDEGEQSTVPAILDVTVFFSGSNFSAGEKQLLALCRALVKDSRIIALVSFYTFFWSILLIYLSGQDEATSSVDVETDAKLQRTIQTEFSNSTLLCIAHRLNTIGKVPRFSSIISYIKGSQRITIGSLSWMLAELLSLEPFWNFSIRTTRYSVRFATKLTLGEKIYFAFGRLTEVSPDKYDTVAWLL